MEKFYSHLKAKEDIFHALAAAQREMVAEGGQKSNSASWAGFLIFGKP
jgi:CHAT domain-containing protein